MTGSIAIVGAGVTGLAAGHELTHTGPAVGFDIFEAAGEVGGMVRGGPVGPMTVDEGADGFLASQPEMADLCREIGLEDHLVSPRTGRAYVFARGELRPMPAPSVLGVPLDPATLEATGIVSPAGLADHRHKIALGHAPLEGDASVGAVLRPRVGDEVFEWLVDPLLGGINAGNADQISIEASAAALFDAARDGGSLPDSLRSRAAESGGPVFHGIRGGSQRIIAALAGSLDQHITIECPVRALERDGSGWQLRTARGIRRFAAVVLATPAPVTAELIGPHAPAAAVELAAVELADVVVAGFVYSRGAIDRELDASGFLVPRCEGLLMTACSWSSAKWDHYDDGEHVVLRVSAGRTDDTRWTAMDDDALITRLRSELKTTMAVEGDPIGIRVSRWNQSLPQYRAGHLDRIAAVDKHIAVATPGVFATGAAFRGLGLPACVRQGRAAARTALEFLDS